MRATSIFRQRQPQGAPGSTGGQFTSHGHSHAETELSAPTDEPAAVFVYGTLREGAGNDHRWHGLGTSRRATVQGLRLYGANFGFPYAVPVDDDEAVAVGEIIEWNDASSREMGMMSLDYLEGYPNHYDRIPVEAIDEDGTAHRVWVYVPHPERQRSLIEDVEPVPGNDWANAERSYLRRSRIEPEQDEDPEEGAGVDMPLECEMCGVELFDHLVGAGITICDDCSI
jgi:gamma-glutamylcyclotransferase (GGCT)/AIG2-like uncharacterized protein YtfP